MTSVKDRVLQYVDYKGIKREDFFIKTNISYSNFRGKSKKSGLNSDTIVEISSLYPDLSLDWLLTGEGEMTKNYSHLSDEELKNRSQSRKAKMKEFHYKSLSKMKEKGIPLIPLDAMAGFGNGDTQIMNYETDMYIVPEFDELNVEFMIRVKGSSMYPKYNSGDIVACKKLPLDTFFQWNKVYVLDTIQGPMIKRIKKSKLENHILIVSDNSSYDPFDLHTDELHSLAIVVGVIRLE